MKKKYIVIIIVVVCLLLISILIILNYNKRHNKLAEELSRNVYDIVEESYINYGDITNSNYKNIVSAKDYYLMYYIRKTEYDTNGESLVDRSRYDILISYHSYPETMLESPTRAKSIYWYESRYAIDGTKEYCGGRSTCTVQWELQDDGIWHIVDFIDPP